MENLQAVLRLSWRLTQLAAKAIQERRDITEEELEELCGGLSEMAGEGS